MLKNAAVTVCLMTCVSLPVSAQSVFQRDIRERVKQAKGDQPLHLVVSPLLPSMSLETVTEHAELVIDGPVVDAVSHLSANGEYIYTDVTVRPTKVLLDGDRARTAPGPTNLPVISLLGGVFEIEGREVIFTDSSLELPRIGQEVVLFAAWDERLGSYAPVGGANGVFVVENSRVKPRSRDKSQLDENRDEFLERVRELLSVRQKAVRH